MRNGKNDCEKKVYVKALKWWVEMGEESSRAYQGSTDAYRKKMQYHDKCRCPKSEIRTCDADCGLCKYAASGDTSSLDELLGGGGADVFEGNRLADFATSEGTLLIAEDFALLYRLLDRLEELDTERCRICNLVAEGSEERAIAAELGFKNRSSANYRKKKTFGLLRDWISEFLD